jgi:hypothetical protein
MIHAFQYDAKTHRNFKWGGKIQNQKGAETGLKCENPADMDIYIKDLPFTERGLRIYVILYL